MPTINTNDLTGPALDWAVAKAEGPVANAYGEILPQQPRYSSDPAEGQPIIEREKISTWDASGVGHEYAWGAYKTINHNHEHHTCGPTALIAAMRCYVQSRLGPTVDVPQELVP